MDIIRQAIEAAQQARTLGYATRARKGQLQFVSVVYDSRGRSTITPHTDYMAPADALRVLREVQS